MTAPAAEVGVERAPEPGCCVDRRLGYKNACKDDTCMRLPEGKTCADCVHVYRCKAMFGVKPTNRTCDFFPRRFLAVAEST